MLFRSILILVAGLLAPSQLTAQRPERATLEITGYVIDAEIDTTTHRLAAKTTVTFKAPENSEMVNFGFHPALKVNKITDASGKVLTGERSADGTIRVTPAAPPLPFEFKLSQAFPAAVLSRNRSRDGLVEVRAVQIPRDCEQSLMHRYSSDPGSLGQREFGYGHCLGSPAGIGEYPSSFISRTVPLVLRKYSGVLSVGMFR